MEKNCNRVKCAICGSPLGEKGQFDRVYCDEHKAYAKVDDKILDEIPLELLFSLIAGIFERARIDYLTDADGKRSDAEVFFRSLWAQDLSLSQFDPDMVLKLMDEEIEYGLDEDAEDAHRAER